MKAKAVLVILLVVAMVMPAELLSAGARPRLDNDPLSLLDDALNVEFISQIGGPIYAVATEEIYTYVGVGPGVVVLDTSDPSAPVVVGRTFGLPGEVWALTLMGDYLYLAGGRGSWPLRTGPAVRR